jgi:hypothetical protein
MTSRQQGTQEPQPVLSRQVRRRIKRQTQDKCRDNRNTDAQLKNGTSDEDRK